MRAAVACFLGVAALVPACALVFDTASLSGAGDGGSFDAAAEARPEAGGDSGGGDAGADSTGADSPNADSGGDSGGDASVDGSSHDAGCSFPIDLFKCTYIPLFTGQQTVDGYPDEFCGFHSVEFDVAQGGDPEPPDADVAAVSTKVDLTMAWDGDGLHLFMHVIQSPVNPPNGQFIWNGDAMEVYASVNDVLTGLYGPGADEALHAIVAPPGSQSPTQESTSWWDNGPVPPQLATNLYASRIVSDGYDVELFLPWSVIAGQSIPSPDAGSTIALDFSCDIQAPDGGRAFQSTLGFQLPTQPAAHCTTPVQSFCDDQTWCLWQLSAQ